MLSRRVWVLESDQRRIQFIAVVAGRAVTGARRPGSVSASRQVSSRFAPCPAGKLDLDSLQTL